MEETNIVNDIEDNNKISAAEADNAGKSQNPLRICALIAIALTALAVALRTLSLFFFYDKEIAYYQRGAILPIISNAVYIAAVLFFVVSAFLILPKAKESDGAKIASPSFVCRMAALLPAAALIYYAASSYIKYGRGEPSGLELVTVVLSVLSVIFFILLAIKQKAPRVTAVAGLAFVAWAAFVWIDSYIDYTVPLNSPDKLFFHFACIALALFTLNELRTLISCTRPRVYYFSALFALLALAVSGLPSLIADTQGVFSRYPSADADIVMIAAFVYVLLRLSDSLPQLRVQTTAELIEHEEDSIEESTKVPKEAAETEETSEE